MASNFKYAWPDNVMELMKEFVNKGMSSADIARSLPMINGMRPTRNAVIGKRSRLGLVSAIKANENGKPAEKTRIVLKKRDLPKVQKVEVRKPTGMPQGPMVVKEHAPPAGVVPELADASHVGPMAIFALNPGMCCYPIGFPKEPDFRYCTAETIEFNDSTTSYCAWHYALTHEPARVRKTKTVIDHSNKVWGIKT